MAVFGNSYFGGAVNGAVIDYGSYIAPTDPCDIEVFVWPPGSDYPPNFLSLYPVFRWTKSIDYNVGVSLSYEYKVYKKNDSGDYEIVFSGLLTSYNDYFYVDPSDNTKLIFISQSVVPHGGDCRFEIMAHDTVGMHSHLVSKLFTIVYYDYNPSDIIPEAPLFVNKVGPGFGSASDLADYKRARQDGSVVLGL